MILQALTRYYHILREDPKVEIPPFGYSATDVSFALHISKEGDLLDVFPLFRQVQRGKKMREVPRTMFVPAQAKRSGSNPKANFLCDNSAFVLGISAKDEEKPDYSAKRFAAFRALHRTILEGVDSEAAQAVLAFLEKHNPATARSHPAIIPVLDRLLKGGNLVFQYRGQFVHEDPEIQKAWAAYQARQEAIEMQCLVTGEVAPIARLHPSLKGIRGAQPTGATLVGFNLDAFTSYGRRQGLNAPVSQQAAFAYTTALNYLLSDANPNQPLILGDTTVVYWAESETRLPESIFAAFVDPDSVTTDAFAARHQAERALQIIAEHIQRGQMIDLEALLTDLADANPRFYVLGLAPNAARVAVRFFVTDPFRNILENVAAHYQDLEIAKEYEDQPAYISIRRILAETVRKESPRDSIYRLAQQASPLLAGAIMRAILTGAPYPTALYYAMLNRIRADRDDKKRGVQQINYVRAAVIKAYLRRKYRHHTQNPFKEVLTMSLNEQSTHPAYVLGRLFAWLERAQRAAIGYDINATIKDRYFTAASTSPASTFPVLLRLAQHHFAKADYGRYIEDQVANLLAKLEGQSFPTHLTLDEQGAFILGYYHQRAAWKNDNPTKTQTQTGE